MARLHTAVLATCFVAAACGLVAPAAAAGATAAATAGDGGVTGPDGVTWYNYTSNDAQAPPFINVNSGTGIVNCAGYNSCYGPVVIQAADNTNLEVRCTNEESCRVMSINCPRVGGTCTIVCTGDNSCRQLSIGYCTAPRCKKICSKTTRSGYCD